MKSGPRLSEELGPALCLVGIIAILLGGSYYALFDLSKPTVYPNPGVEAYHSPEATRLVPLPRVSDAPEVAAEPVGEAASESASVLPQAPAPHAPAKEAAAPSHKSTRTSQNADPRGLQRWDNFRSSQSWNSFGYARQWDNPYRDNPYRSTASNYPGFGRDAPPRARISGGPKSPF